MFGYLNSATLQTGIGSKLRETLPATLLTKFLNCFIQHLKSKDLIPAQLQPITLPWALRHYSDLLILHFSDCFLRTYKLQENISAASAVSIVTPRKKKRKLGFFLLLQLQRKKAWKPASLSCRPLSWVTAVSEILENPNRGLVVRLWLTAPSSF